VDNSRLKKLDKACMLILTALTLLGLCAANSLQRLPARKGGGLCYARAMHTNRCNVVNCAHIWLEHEWPYKFNERFYCWEHARIYLEAVS
jgi:hypothetical protein